MAGSTSIQLPSLQALQSTDQMELLDIVDSLRAEGLGEITALPQLIVCGDQSSGKSSVLEAISGIPFPRKENTCTRFATEVILRRTPENRISVSIVPSRDRRQPDREQLLKFRHELSTRDDFPDLFDKAKAVMLSGPRKSFSKDILRIEFCGPSQSQLTLVDLPGLIHSHVEAELQTPEDVKLVTDLVSDYLRNPRSIILAIVSAKYDINVQAILNRAREVDPQGTRTLGIITKPDTLMAGSESEEAFIKLARNERVQFRLGWHVVKNLDSANKETQETTLGTRDAQEKGYFKDSNFKSLPSHTVGIISLRAKLSKVLFHQIRFELPRLVEDIEQRISTNRAARDKCGPSRAAVDEQREFLIRLSQSFQTICQAAVRGDYDHEFFQSDENTERRLCANLMNKHFEFAEDLRNKGSLWNIVEAEANDEVRSRTREEAIKDACKLLKRSRGRELPGLPNPLLVGELFREYSRPWEGLARMHIKNVWEATNRFLELVLQHLTDDDAREKILRLWLNPIMSQKLDAAYNKLDELLEVHKEHPLTTNHHFLDNRKKLQQKNNQEELQEMLNREFAKPTQKLSVEDVSRLMSNLNTAVNPDMDMVAAEDAFDNMNAYYEVAMKLFMDNVPTLVIQAPIIRKLDEMLCPIAVYHMNPELVTKIAGESDEKIRDREEILSRLGTLERGAQICRQYAMRPQSYIPSQMKERVEPGDQDGAQKLPQERKDARQKPGDSLYGEATPVAQGKADAPAASLTQSSPPVISKSSSGSSIPSKDPMQTATALQAPKTAAKNDTSIFQNLHLKDYSIGSAENPFNFLSSSAASKPSNSSGLSFGNAVSPTHLESEKLKLSKSLEGSVKPAGKSVTPSKGLFLNALFEASSQPLARVTDFGSSSTMSMGSGLEQSSSGTTQPAFGSSQKADSSNSKSSSTDASGNLNSSKSPFARGLGEPPLWFRSSESAEVAKEIDTASWQSLKPNPTFLTPFSSHEVYEALEPKLKQLYCSITAIPNFRKFSFEELRLSDLMHSKAQG